jgi:hypothetical protein
MYPRQIGAKTYLVDEGLDKWCRYILHLAIVEASHTSPHARRRRINTSHESPPHKKANSGQHKGNSQARRSPYGARCNIPPATQLVKGNDQTQVGSYLTALGHNRASPSTEPLIS